MNAPDPMRVLRAALDPILDQVSRLDREAKSRPAPRDGRDGLGLDLAPWRPGQGYAEGEVVGHFVGRVYRAVRPTREEPGDSDHWERVGNGGFRFRGERTEAMRLEVGDVYKTAEGAVFLVDHDGAPAALALRGAPGEKGDRGDAGHDGAGLDAPAWEERVYREGAVVTHHFGQVFRALVDTVGEPGASADWKRIGLGGLRWRSPPEEGEPLEPGDLVPVDGSLFFVDAKGHRHLAVQRGERGRRGEPGAPGKAGADGGAVLDVTLGTSALVFRLGLPGAEREVEVDLTEVVESIAAELVVRQVRPVLEEIGRRLADLERRRA